MSYFEHIPAIRYEGPQSDNPLAYHHYDPERRVLGKTLAEHLRIAVCYWHTFVWPGHDIRAGRIPAAVAAAGRRARTRAAEGRCGIRILHEARHAFLYVP